MGQIQICVKLHEMAEETADKFWLIMGRDQLHDKEGVNLGVYSEPTVSCGRQDMYKRRRSMHYSIVDVKKMLKPKFNQFYSQIDSSLSHISRRDITSFRSRK